jgi:hypothetical protein
VALTSNSIKKKLNEECKFIELPFTITLRLTFRNRVTVKQKANKPKGTENQEKPDNEAPRTMDQWVFYGGSTNDSLLHPADPAARKHPEGQGISPC